MAENKANRITLRDVAVAALELDADGRGRVTWEDVVIKARALATGRAQATQPPEKNTGDDHE